MTSKNKTAAVVAPTTTAKQNNDQAVRTIDPTALALVPSDGSDWWHFELHVNNRPVLRLVDPRHAIDVLTAAVDDATAGVDLTNRQALDDLAGGTLRPADYINGVRYEVCA